MALWGSRVRISPAPPGRSSPTAHLKNRMDSPLLASASILSPPDPTVCIPAGIPARLDGSVTIGQAIKALLHVKRLANLRPQYIKSLRTYLAQFAHGREQVPIVEFDVFSIEAWFDGRSEGLSTQVSNTGRLSALFAFCERRGWIDKNPCKLLERPRVDRKPPLIMRPEQAHKLISAVMSRRTHMLAFFVLSLFGGIRPDEIARIGWNAVDTSRGIVTIDAAASKIRRRRLVQLDDRSIQLLRLSAKLHGRLPVSRTTRRRYLGFACAVLGLEEWPHDFCRHTAASYLLARDKDAGKVALMLGNSADTLLSHYQELVSAEDCAVFWAPYPALC